MASEVVKEMQRQIERIKGDKVVDLVALDAAAAKDAEKASTLKASSVAISEGARRTQKIIESMDLRQQERARLVAALKSREVEVGRQDVEARTKLDEDLKALDSEYRRRAAAVTADCTGGIYAREADIHGRRLQIEKIDHSLAQLRTQLTAEISKLDPDRSENS